MAPSIGLSINLSATHKGAAVANQGAAAPATNFTATYTSSRTQ